MLELLLLFGLAVGEHVAGPPEASPSHELSTRDEVVDDDIEPGRYGVGEPWATLAECESGNWIDGGASFERGSARWDWGDPGMDIPPWGNHLHSGGLQWQGSTWDWLAPIVLGEAAPAHAYDASPEQEVAVAEHYVQLEQTEGRGGWGPWPTCAPMVGLPT